MAGLGLEVAGRWSLELVELRSRWTCCSRWCWRSRPDRRRLCVRRCFGLGVEDRLRFGAKGCRILRCSRCSRDPLCR